MVVGAWLSLGAALAAEVEGVKLADKVRLSDAGPELVLNGAGLRSRAFFKVYVGALYLQKKAGNTQSVLADSGPKRVAMHMLRDLTAEQLFSALNDGLKNNHAPGGFSDQKPWLPIPQDHAALNVVSQDAADDSPLNATRRFLRWRKSHPALVEGDIAFLDAPEPILAFVRRHGNDAMLVAFNLSGKDVAWQLPAHTDANAIGDHRLASGRIGNGTLHLPARGVFFAKA